MNFEQETEKLAKEIYATGVAIDGTDIAYGADDEYDHFHRMARKLHAAGYRRGLDVINELVNRIMADSDEFFPSMARKHIRKCASEMIQEIRDEMRMLGYHGMLYEETKTDLRIPKQITEQEEKQKDKIVEILQSRPFKNSPYKDDVSISYITACDIARTLMLAEIGDVEKWEHIARLARKEISDLQAEMLYENGKSIKKTKSEDEE